MSRWNPAVIAGCAFLILILLVSGCTSTTIGNVAYRNETITVSILNSGESEEAFVQVTVYEIRDLHQQKLTVFQVPATLRSGQNEIHVPGTLAPGSYKLYVYILKPDARQTATIRDITV